MTYQFVNCTSLVAMCL